jgi:hypothetical protein
MPIENVAIEAIDDQLARAMSEAELQESVRRLCEGLGLLYYHTHDARRSPEGFPDCVIGSPRGGRIIVRELKRERQNPTPAQQKWLNALGSAHGISAGVWRPRDLINRTIARELVELRGRS